MKPLIRLSPSIWLLGACSAQIFSSHSGTIPPGTEGWNQSGTGSSVSSAAIARAWKIDDAHTASSLYFERLATPQQIASAQQRGWTLRTTVEIANAGDAPDRSSIVSFSDGVTTWSMVFGADAARHATVLLFAGENGGCPVPVGPSYTLATAGGFHQYELVSCPALGVDLRVDGAPSLLAYAGHGANVGHSGAGVIWGSTSACSTGRTHFMSVAWFVPTPLPAVPGFTVEQYAFVENPAQLAFTPQGDLLVGRDTLLSPVHPARIAPGGAVVEVLGDSGLVDPDGVAFDAAGTFAPSGSILVASGTITSPHMYLLDAILPTQAVQRIFQGTAMINPNGLMIDRAGRLLLAEDEYVNSTGAVFVSQGAAPILHYTLPARLHAGSLAVTANNDILTCDVAGTLRMHGAAGNFIRVVLTGLGGEAALASGAGGPVWGNDACVVNSTIGHLIRVFSSGSTQDLDGNLVGSAGDLEAGPGDALYLVDYRSDRILRITPEHLLMPQAPFAVGTNVPLRVISPSDAGRFYLCLFAGGTTPGIPIDTRVLPLNPDPLLLLSLIQPNAVFQNNLGVLDGQGLATVSVALPNDPGLRGGRIHAAFLALDAAAPSGVQTISPALAIVLE